MDRDLKTRLIQSTKSLLYSLIWLFALITLFGTLMPVEEGAAEPLVYMPDWLAVLIICCMGIGLCAVRKRGLSLIWAFLIIFACIAFKIVTHPDGQPLMFGGVLIQIATLIALAKLAIQCAGRRNVFAHSRLRADKALAAPRGLVEPDE